MTYISPGLQLNGISSDSVETWDSDMLSSNVFEILRVFSDLDFFHIFWVSNVSEFQEFFELENFPGSKHFSNTFFGIYVKKYIGNSLC